MQVAQVDVWAAFDRHGMANMTRGELREFALRCDEGSAEWLAATQAEPLRIMRESEGGERT